VAGVAGVAGAGVVAGVVPLVAAGGATGVVTFAAGVPTGAVPLVTFMTDGGTGAMVGASVCERTYKDAKRGKS